jgi:septal ring factor EnvC (AmiA/AmiB activator)
VINHKRILRVTIIVILLGIFEIAYLQKTGKDELLKRKIDIENEIALANKLLEETREKQQYSISELMLIKSNIKKRNRLIEQFNSELSGLEVEIDKKNKELLSYIKDLERTKKEYAALIYYAFKNRNANIEFMYLLASEDINQFYTRYIYLKQYKEYRLKNIELIKKLKIVIEVNIHQLTINRNEKLSILSAIKTEKASMVQDEDRAKKVVSSLKQQESDLLKQIEEKKRIAEKLEKEIEDLIKKEAKKNKLENLTPADKIVSNDFIKNKGRLPWPTERGVITDHFGEHEHPVMKNVNVRNNGIDITSIANAKARAVFNGDVSKVFTIKGANTTVIIRHGNFYTVYHNLINVTVRIGDKVTTKQNIGDIYTNTKSGETILHFELWKEMEKQNPEEWLSN